MNRRLLSAIAEPNSVIKHFTSSSFRTRFRLHDITRSAPADSTANMFSYLNPLPHLSKYRGPHKVGSTEFEIPVSEIQSSTTVPDARVTTVKFRVFYPTTPTASSKKSISWLPTPQKVWTQAYAQFMGISESKATWISKLPSVLNYATIPALQNAPLLELSASKPHPLIIFSHGLGGNCNTYSSLLGNLASCGVVCVAPEHRDGSAPISLIKSSREKVQTTIDYEKVAHQPTAEVLNARNAMLRVRLWEVELIYSAISQMNQGKQFTNFAETVTETSKPPNFQNAFDLRPSKVTWGGHSFGSATTVQFVKSVYYHKQAPAPTNSSDNAEWNMTPLYTPSTDSELIKQITPTSPIVLLDLWTMPLRGATTRWLWEKPLPCYDHSTSTASSKPNVISIMSAEFHKWTDLLTRTRATLSANPEETLSSIQQEPQAQRQTNPSTTSTSTSSKPPAESELDEPAEPELMPIRTTSSLDADDPPVPDKTPISSRSPSPPPSTSSNPDSPAHLYLVPHSAHLSQSDFGPLFPNFTRYFMKALDPEKTIELNVRAILALMRGAGIEGVEALDLGRDASGEKESVDRILDQSVVVDRWVRVKL